MKKESTTQKYDKAHLLNMAKYQRAVQSILDKMCEEAAALGISTGFENGSGGSFSWDKFPKARKKFTDLMWRVRKDLEATIGSGIEEEWKLSNIKNEQLVNELVGKIGLTMKQIEELEPRRMEGVQAFQARKVQGLGLSDRIWNTTSLAEAQIAEAIEQNLSNGTPASKLSQDVRHCLKDPDMMYRRYHHKITLKDGTKKDVRVWHKRIVDADGKVHFVEAPLEAVGTGVYRSAYKNAMRMARTETNMAYHKADSNYFSSSDIVLGIEIKLSNNHTTTYGEGNKTKPLTDICDELQGKYPKWFDYTGWHPNCRCVAMPINPSREEMKKYLKMLANGEDVSNFKFTGEVTTLPDNFRAWAVSNEDRLAKMQRRGKLPYFMRENISKNFRFGYGVDIDAAMKWSPYDFDYDEDHDMLLQSEVTSFSGETKTPQQIMQDREAMIQAMLANDLAQYSDAIQRNIDEIAKAIGQNRGLSMSWEDANTGKENPHYHDKVTRYERDAKGGYIWVKKGRGFAAKETKEYQEHKQWTVNCQTCTLIHELRRRGFNVEACGNKRGSVWKVYEKKGVGKKYEGYRIGKWLNDDGTPVKPFYASEWAKNEGRTMSRKSDAWDFFHAMMKNEGRYEIYIDWNSGSAHVFCAEKLSDGTIHFFDPQSGKEGKALIESYLESANKKLGKLGIVRTDNKLINPKLAETFIPIGELPIDVPNRPDNRELYRAQGDARHAARTPERVAEIKAFYRKWMGRYYTKKAEQRHADRTKEREQEIRDFWAKKKEEGEIRRRQERWDAAKEKRHAERDEKSIRAKAQERQEKIKEAKQKIQSATDTWKKVDDWLKVNPLDTDEAQYHLYEYAVKADELYARASLILSLRPKYEMVAMYKLKYGNYKDLLKSVKQHIIDGDAIEANQIIDQLDIAKDMEPLYIDMVAYTKAHPSKSKTGKKTKIEIAMQEAEECIKRGDFMGARSFVEDAKKVRDINEASNAQKAAKRKEEKEKKAEPKKNGKTLADAKSWDDIKDILGDKMPKTLEEYNKALKEYPCLSAQLQKHQVEIEGWLRDLFQTSDWGCAIKHKFLDSLLEKGLLNTFQTGTSGGYNGSSKTSGKIEEDHMRLPLAQLMFTPSTKKDIVKSGYRHVYRGKQYDRGQYEKYGHLLDHDKTKSMIEQYVQYGDVQIRFRKDKVVPTWTFGDTLNKFRSKSEYLQPSLAVDPKIHSFDERLSRLTEADCKSPINLRRAGHGAEYIEMQYHGDVTPDCIESITLPGDPESYISKENLKKWYDLGVDIFYMNSKTGKVELYKAGKRETPEEKKARIEQLAKKRRDERDKKLGMSSKEYAKKLLNERKEEQKKAKKATDDYLSKEADIASKDISLKPIKDRLANGDYLGARSEMEKIKKAHKEIEKRENALVDLIPDVKDWHKQFTMDELEFAYKKIKSKYAKLESMCGDDDAKWIKKLDFDIDYIEDPQKYNAKADPRPVTWKVTQEAYKRKRLEIYKRVVIDPMTKSLNELKAYKTGSKIIKDLIAQADDLVAKGEWDLVGEKIAEALKVKAKNEASSASKSKKLKVGEGLGAKFEQEAYSETRKALAQWFKNEKDPQKAFNEVDKVMTKQCGEVWNSLTDEEKHVLCMYTAGSCYMSEPFYTRYIGTKVSPYDGTIRRSEDDINLLTSVLEKSSTPKDMWVQHSEDVGTFFARFGVDLRSSASLKSAIGKEGMQDSFMSTSCAKHSYFTKKELVGRKSDVVMSIYLPEGTKGMYVEPFAWWGDGKDTYGDESTRYKQEGIKWDGSSRSKEGRQAGDQVEFLLQRGSKLRITKAEYKEGRWFVECELVEQKAVDVFKCGY